MRRAAPAAALAAIATAALAACGGSDLHPGDCTTAAPGAPATADVQAVPCSDPRAHSRVTSGPADYTACDLLEIRYRGKAYCTRPVRQ